LRCLDNQADAQRQFAVFKRYLSALVRARSKIMIMFFAIAAPARSRDAMEKVRPQAGKRAQNSAALTPTARSR
jgi:hypothetical protein